ncbi:hypothetical protein EI94DRAFT_575522 [Lactarius quietus]|nr:hypothetical protein EI94DRAFT_575522 [Lactarius quietus]
MRPYRLTAVSSCPARSPAFGHGHGRPPPASTPVPYLLQVISDRRWQSCENESSPVKGNFQSASNTQTLVVATRRLKFRVFRHGQRGGTNAIAPHISANSLKNNLNLILNDLPLYFGQGAGYIKQNQNMLSNPISGGMNNQFVETLQVDSSFHRTNFPPNPLWPEHGLGILKFCRSSVPHTQAYDTVQAARRCHLHRPIAPHSSRPTPPSTRVSAP